MDVIPVIDIKDGIVVHARRGERAGYRPIDTPLSASPDPVAVIDGLLSRGAFAWIYVADLDAITRQGGNAAAISRIARAHPDLGIWLDAGFDETRAIERALSGGAVDIVFGTESLASIAHYQRLLCAVPPARAVLSLDRAGDDRLGCADLFDVPDAWPERVIDMNLRGVGGAGGPDLDGLARLRRQAPRCRVYAAGGVRDDADLERLASLGASGALVATALHAGMVTRVRIEP